MYAGPVNNTPILRTMVHSEPGIGQSSAMSNVVNGAGQIHRTTEAVLEAQCWGTFRLIPWGKQIIRKCGVIIGVPLTLLLGPILLPAAIAFATCKIVSLSVRKVTQSQGPVHKLLPLAEKQMADVEKLKQNHTELLKEVAARNREFDQLKAEKAQVESQLASFYRAKENADRKHGLEKAKLEAELHSEVQHFNGELQKLRIENKQLIDQLSAHMTDYEGQLNQLLAERDQLKEQCRQLEEVRQHETDDYLFAVSLLEEAERRNQSLREEALCSGSYHQQLASELAMTQQTLQEKSVELLKCQKQCNDLSLARKCLQGQLKKSRRTLIQTEAHVHRLAGEKKQLKSEIQQLRSCPEITSQHSDALESVRAEPVEVQCSDPLTSLRVNGMGETIKGQFLSTEDPGGRSPVLAGQDPDSEVPPEPVEAIQQRPISATILKLHYGLAKWSADATYDYVLKPMAGWAWNRLWGNQAIQTEGREAVYASVSGQEPEAPLSSSSDVVADEIGRWEESISSNTI